MVARLQSGLGADETQIYRVESPLDLSELRELAAIDRPELTLEPWIPAIPPRLAAAQIESPRDLRRDPARRRPRAPAVRLVPGELRGVRAGGGARSERHRDEDGRVPDERRQRARRLADPVRRGGEAVGLPRRAQGPVRRAAQHRVVAGARAGRRPRRVRIPGPQDPREDDADRPPRGRRAAPLRAHRHRQLPRRDGTTLRRPRDLHRRRGRSRPTSRISSTTSRASGARRSSASCSSPRSRFAAGSSTRSAPSRSPRPRASTLASVSS